MQPKPLPCYRASDLSAEILQLSDFHIALQLEERKSSISIHQSSAYELIWANDGKKLFAHESLIAKLLENWIFIITATPLSPLSQQSFRLCFIYIVPPHSDQPIKGSLSLRNHHTLMCTYRCCSTKCWLEGRRCCCRYIGLSYKFNEMLMMIAFRMFTWNRRKRHDG